MSKLIEEVYDKIKTKTYTIPEGIIEYSISKKKYPKELIHYLRSMNDEDKMSFKNKCTHYTIKDTLKIEKKHLNSSVSKLLYLMVWKQGDLDKFDQIVEGLNSEKELTVAYSKKNKSFVFFQFGRHIMFNEPIVDQHSIRSFAALIQVKKIKIEAFQNKKIQFKDIKNSLLTNVNKELIVEYVKWVQSITMQRDEMDQIDDLMYALGKYLKTVKKT
jgi:hypothetical protein